MRDAAVERLTKLITNDSSSPDSRKGLPSRRLEIHLRLEEGWFSLFLLAAVVYSTIWSIQAARWVENLNVLSLTTALGLIGGVLVAKQRRFSPAALHGVALLFGLLFAFWQTAGAFYGGNTLALLHGLQRWYEVAVNGGSSNDDSIFLFLILSLGYILAYVSAWLVYHARNPWLMIVANMIVLLINLSALENGYVVFLIVFLVASLLLLLRFNLFESIRRWRRQGLRYADDLAWDVMQAGALISIGILVLSWLLPAGYTDPVASQIWSVSGSANPLVQVQNNWDRLLSFNALPKPTNHGSFRDTLALGGNPNLNNELVFTVQTDGSGSQYLQLLTYDIYTPQGWSVSQTEKFPLKASQVQPPRAQMVHLEKQTITVINPPAEQNPYIIGAPEITQLSMPADVVYNNAAGTVVAWLGKYGNLPAGTRYTVVSAVSSADEKTLRSVPMPDAAPRYPPTFEGQYPLEYFDPGIVQNYTQLPPRLDPAIAQLASRITADKKTMYDKVVALESYLRTNFTYEVNIHRPANEDGVSWFLFRSERKGFCNYFASAMAVMARTLGIPARVAAGYTNGTYDTKSHQWKIYGKDAHAWTQIYFAGYGWINFEPSASFPTFSRPLPNQFTPITPDSGSSGSGAANVANDANKLHLQDIEESSGAGVDSTATAADLRARYINITLGSLVLILLFSMVLFGIWWRRLYRRYALAAQIYGRICILASWAGIRIEPSQTPYEYVQTLSAAALPESPLLKRLGDIYVRDRWADPESKEHPRRSGEIDELPSLWKRLQPRLFLYVLRHPHFLRWLPERIGGLFRHLRQRRKMHQRLEEEDF
ncbi:MAG: transglutaminase domain-containing protein [Ktedonobacteraceae bacterium]|nr:transglutaminase domain-containing protein [Ktedonobacteraceae bacterium]